MLASAAMKLLLGASSFFFHYNKMPWPLLQAAIVEADCFDDTMTREQFDLFA